MTYFRIMQFFAICMLILVDLVCSSFLDVTHGKQDDNLNLFLLNVSNAKYQYDKSDEKVSHQNNLNLKYKKNILTVRNTLKERRLPFISGYKPYNSALKCGSFVDMCGECEGTRVDQCNVCAGNNHCVGCDGHPDNRRDACGRCLPPLDSSWNDCAAVIYVHPAVLDKAVNTSGELKLELTKPLEEDDSLQCLVLQNNITVSARVTAVEETTVTLSVPLQQLTAEAQLRCEGWTVPQQPLMVVNSLSLSVSSVSPNEILLGAPTQLKLMVHGVSAPVDVICFLMNQNQTVLMTQTTNQVAGNPMSTTVLCPVTLTRPSDSEMSVGVSYTRDAINRMSTNNTMRLTLQATPLTPLRADFSEDLSYVWVEFNQNIDGPSNCSGVFKASSVSLLGTGFTCEYRGNNLLVKLGHGASLRPRDVLRLSQNVDSATGLRLAGSRKSSPITQDSVHLPFTKKSLPAYLVVGPSKVCQSSHVSVTVVPLTGQMLWYNWSVVVTEVQPWTQTEQRQRRNLLVWLGAREILRPARHANLLSLHINSSLLMPNINYRIEVVAQNKLGLVGPPARLNIQLAETNSASTLGLVILCPASASASQSLPLELSVTSGCGHFSMDGVKFQWKVSRENHSITLDSSGTKATVPARNLQTSGLYNITCIMINNSAIMTQVNTQVLVQPAKIGLSVVPAAVVVGTGISLVLDVTRSLQNYNISAFQAAISHEQLAWATQRATSCPISLAVHLELGNSFGQLQLTYRQTPSRYTWTHSRALKVSVKDGAELFGAPSSPSLEKEKAESLQISTTPYITWTCMTAGGQACITPGSDERVSITHGSTLTRPKLILPPGSLSVGRYQWTVTVRQQDVESSSSADVEVVEGHPPFLTTGLPSLGGYLTLPASAQGLRPGCRLQWSSLPLLGYNFLLLSNVSRSNRVISSGSRGDLTLMVPARMLQPGAHYRMRFSAFCSAAESAYADVIVPVDPVPASTAIQVSPLQGVALITQFNFSMNRTTQFGSIYSFGFYPPSGSPLFFYSSAYSLSTQTTLPAFSTTGSKMRTVAKVCSSEQVCSTQDGPLVQTSLPTSLSSQQTRALSMQVSAAIEEGDPLEVVASASSTLSTTKLLKDQTAHQTVSTSAIEAILRRINITSQRLEKDISTRSNAILFLDSVTRILPMLQLNDSALSTVVAFRDKLASTTKTISKPARLLLESYLPMEPRTSREKRQQPIPAEAHPETPDTVEIWLRTSETAILSFSPSKSLEEKQKLVSNLDSYVTGLCLWLHDPQPVFLGSRVVNLSVQKLSITEKQQIIEFPNCPEDCDPPPAKIFLGKEIISIFKKAMVEHICLSGFQFPSGSLEMVFSSPPGFIQISVVYRLKLLIYSARAILKDETSQGVKLVIPFQSPPSLSAQHAIKCCILMSGTWTEERCETMDTNELAVTCKCPPYEYYSVFAVPIPTTTTTSPMVTTTSLATTPETEPPSTTKESSTVTITTVDTITSSSQITTIPPTTSNGLPTSSTNLPSSNTPTPLPIKMTTESSQPAKKVAFRIAGRFHRVVGQNATEFSNLIKQQLIEQLGLPKESIQDIYVTDGSILVTLALRNTEQLSAEECVLELAQALDVGQLNLRTADNQPLDVPRQPLQVLREHKGEQSGLSAVFLASASLGLCGLVVIYVTLVAIITKHSRESPRADQRKAAVKVPRYSTLPLPHTLDGSSNLRQGTWSGDDLDSGIYDSDGGKRNAMGKTPKPRTLQSTSF